MSAARSNEGIPRYFVGVGKSTVGDLFSSFDDGPRRLLTLPVLPLGFIGERGPPARGAEPVEEAADVEFLGRDEAAADREGEPSTLPSATADAPCCPRCLGFFASAPAASPPAVRLFALSNLLALNSRAAANLVVGDVLATSAS